MRKYISKIIGIIMVIGGVIFFVFALNHPEMSFPWSSAVTYFLYLVYIGVTIFLIRR